MNKKLLGAAALMAMAAVMAAGCGGGDKKAAAPAADAKKGPSGEVSVYTSIYPDIVDKLCKPNVSKAFPNLKVTWFQNGTEKLKTKIAGEIKAKKIGADVLMVADPSYYLALKKQGLLMNYKSPQLKDVVLASDPDGAWLPVRVNNMIIAYNKDKLAKEDIPTSWEDLTKPKYKGKIAMPNPMLSGTAYVMVGAMALDSRFGWDYFKKLKANGLRVEEGNSAIQNKLLTGEYMAAVILEENILKLQETKKEPLAVCYPKEGCIIINSPIGIFKDTKNPEAAKALVDWWLSPEGQKAVTAGWMHSVRGDVNPPNGAGIKLADLNKNAIKIDWEKLAFEEGKIKEAFRTNVME
ncbi:ABC transporter substrate-binding protein [Succiniclasticum ruminis]|uniref:Iron(III) transport system substrate-binding protein n=1 Tax=Succiniclasticum ruminis DSM 9236 TaxID=1123323 RepID=A0A1I2CT14_9FIRM|nr:ABC transporter substrate-binding protein [Succiniclasticum ruminis]MBQ3365803.1 ABC transporter substrate-binding protein [Acidaminococcaceae bacterium]MBR0293756.1 ABC transporter substrate-binding protein [Acidaminococcaceae bacterium]SFE71398.1 iron(III) transport system substrate-binding protein [Succiniclasticum ruminis DSM 9236]